VTQIITVHGGLTAAPELRFTNSGIPFLTGTVASTDRFLDKKTNEWRDGKKLFLRFTAWNDIAENISQSALDKGTQVAVTGRLHTREFQDKDGTPRTSTELEVIDFLVSLKRATAVVTRVQKTAVGGAQNSWGDPNPTGGGFGAPGPDSSSISGGSAGFDGFDTEERPF